MTGVAGSIGGTFSCPDLVVRENDNGTGPKAYLNYLVFDRDFHYLTGGFRRVSALASESGANLETDAEGIFHEHLHFGDGIVIQEAGYVYIYLSNENETPVEVFFDDFKVEHVNGAVVQMDDYYPFGLTFNSYSRESTTPQDFKFNCKEEQTELNLAWLDFGARMYQPELGRFFTQDRFAEKYYDLTPYHFGANNPLMYIDVNGDSIVNAHQSEMQAIADDLNRVYESTYGEENVFSVQERTKTVKKRTNNWSIWKPSTWGNMFEEAEYENVEVKDYALVGREDFDWGKDKYTQGMYDLMQTSQNVTVDIVGDNSPQYKQSVRLSNEGLLKDYGGGFTVSSNYIILSNKLSKSTANNKSSSWTLGRVAMHELLYHVHPGGTSEGGNPN